VTPSPLDGHSDSLAFIISHRDEFAHVNDDGSTSPPLNRQLWIERNADGGAHFGISVREDNQSIPVVAGLNLRPEELAALVEWASK
jgi:hypothetical protein